MIGGKGCTSAAGSANTGGNGATIEPLLGDSIATGVPVLGSGRGAAARPNAGGALREVVTLLSGSGLVVDCFGNADHEPVAGLPASGPTMPCVTSSPAEEKTDDALDGLPKNGRLNERRLPFSFSAGAE